MHLRSLFAAVRIVLLAAVLFSVRAADAAESAFALRTNDVIVFVGGEDMVEMQRNGYFELLLTVATPGLNLRFRSLAFEGDTVFEQHRQLNFPSWNQQLEQVGATVIISQFGQAEMLAGTNKLSQFLAAYEKLLNHFTNGGRRLLLLSPTPFENPALPQLAFDPADATGVIAQMALRRGHPFVSLDDSPLAQPIGTAQTRDGIHLNAPGQWRAARMLSKSMVSSALVNRPGRILANGTLNDPGLEAIRQLIIEKNRLWFDYWRPQNWAFLKGDRTDQPSSRDHRDPKKRWFPEEMEKFLPLIEAKEREIWKTSAALR
jgi:hypothetical protein